MRPDEMDAPASQGGRVKAAPSTTSEPDPSKQPAVAPDESAIEAFLASVSGLVVVCHLGRQGMKAFTLDASKPAERLKAARLATTYNCDGEQLYFALNPPKERMFKKPEKSETGLARFAHVEIDPHTFMKAMGSYAAARAYLHDEVARELTRGPNPPSCLWSSGNGISAMWRLSEPVEHSVVELLNRRLIERYGGDAGTHNVDRVLRLPGSVNHPTKKKIAKGYPNVARLAAVMHSNPDAAYSVEQLSKGLPEAQTAPVAEHETPETCTPAAALSPDEISELEARFDLDLQADVLLAARWHGRTKPPKDGSRSGMDFSLGAMLKARDYTYPEVRHLLSRWDLGAGREKEEARDERYFRRIWGRTNETGITADEVIADIEFEVAAVYSSPEQLPVEFWASRMWEARLDRVAQDRVLNRLVELGVGKKRAVNAAWNTAREKYAGEYRRRRAEQKVAIALGERKKQLWDPTDLRKMLTDTEHAMLERGNEELPLLHNGEGYVTLRVRAPAGFVAIDSNASDAPDTVLFSAYDKTSMHLRIEHSVRFFEYRDKDGPVAVPVPYALTDAMLHNPLPVTVRTTALAPHPIVLPDGRCVGDEGPLAESGLYLSFGVEPGYFKSPPSLAADPLAQAKEALGVIEHDLYGEFPFADRLDLVIAMSMTFALLARKLLDICPGYLWNASERGVGKTTGVRLNHIVATGHDLAVASLGRDGEEMDKFIMSILIEQLALVCFDNLEPDGTLRSTTLSKLTTAPTYTGRLLGFNKVATLPSNVLWTMTGNGIELDEDLAERILRIDLRAFKKKHFEHPDVLAHGRAIRASVISAVHTVQRNYILAGAPVLATPSRFPAWDRMARFPLLWATGTDVATKLDAAREASPERTLDTATVRLLRELFMEASFTATKVQSQLAEIRKNVLLFSHADETSESKATATDDKKNESAERNERAAWWRLYEVVAQRCPRGVESPGSLGRYLSKLRNRSYGNPPLVVRRVEGDEGVVYRVEDAK